MRDESWTRKDRVRGVGCAQDGEIAVGMTCSPGHDGVVRDVGTGANQARPKNVGRSRTAATPGEAEGMARIAATVGIDVGTSGTKGVLVAEDGRVLARRTLPYPLLTPRPGWTEQDPEAWWAAARDILRHLTTTTPEAEIVGVGLSGQMHGSVFLDHEDRVIRPALLWNDARTGEECREIERRVGAERVVAITGNRASAGFQAPKILWLQRHEPEAHARLARVLLPKDLLRLRLTGEAATDASDASGTLLLDLATRRYSPELTEALGIPPSWLPRVHESAEVTGRVAGQAAAETGLPAGTPVVAGGGDNACAA